MKKKISYGSLLVIFFLISCCIDFYTMLKGEGVDLINYTLNNTLTQEEIVFLGIVIVIVFIINIVKFGFFIGVYFCVKLVNKKIKKEKLSEIDFKKYDGYFRDILKGYNPAELSYIDDFTVDKPKDYVAILLSLKNRRIIDFDELNEKIIIKNKNASLTRTEAYFLDNIVDGKLKRFPTISISGTIQNDALQKGILKQKDKNINLIKAFITSFILIMVIVFSFNIFFQINFETTNIYLIIGIIVLLFISCLLVSVMVFFMPIYFLIYLFKSASHPYVRSELGEEINKRLEGLKNYLKDFSYMNERKAEELIIWEDYLVYSVLFNQNSKIVDEVVDKYFEK